MLFDGRIFYKGWFMLRKNLKDNFYIQKLTEFWMKGWFIASYVDILEFGSISSIFSNKSLNIYKSLSGNKLHPASSTPLPPRPLKLAAVTYLRFCF